MITTQGEKPHKVTTGVESITSAHWIEEEEELPYSGANIEGVEGLFEAVQLGEGWYELQNVILQILPGDQRASNHL